MMEKPNVNNDTEVRIHDISDRSEDSFVRTIARVSNSSVILSSAVFTPFNVACGFSFSLMTITIAVHIRDYREKDYLSYSNLDYNSFYDRSRYSTAC